MSYKVNTVLLSPEQDFYDDAFVVQAIMSLEEYVEYCSRWNIDQAYTEPGNYAVYSDIYEGSLSVNDIYTADSGQTLTVRIYTPSPSFPINGTEGHVLVIPVEDTIDGLSVYEAPARWSSPFVFGCAKPIIYLYPTEETALTVTLGQPEKLSCVYPAYNGGWQVLAQPDGTLTDLSTGRSLYALYWEGKDAQFARTDEGFVIAGCDTAAFLEEKLALLGLSEREAEEFIVYWLPKMQNNACNYIRFASAEEIEAYMPLSFSVQPDSVIRVMMVWQPLTAPVPVREQVLQTPERSGFVAVEWGGTELD